MVQGKNPKKTAAYNINAEVLAEFDKYCEDNAHNKSAVVEQLMRNWLLACGAWAKK